MTRKLALIIISPLVFLIYVFFIIRFPLLFTIHSPVSAQTAIPALPGAESTTQSILVDWNPAWNNDLGWAAALVRPPIVSWLIIENGMLIRDGQEFIFFGTALNQASTALDTDYKIQKTLQRIAAQGFNAVRLGGMDAKYMGQMAWNYGCWANATGPEFSETFMVRLDKTIAIANSLGLQVWIGGFDFDQPVTRVAGLPTGTYKSYGMGWSSEFRDIEKAHILRFANRVNTQTGVRYIDNPGIVWQADNENGFSDAYFDHGPTAAFGDVRWFDQIVDQTNGHGYWKAELDAKIRGYYAAKGWILPENQFPKWSTWDSWADLTDKQHFMQFVTDTDLEYATDIYNWFKSLNPNTLVNINTFNYMDGRVLNITDIASYHSYARTPSGDPIGSPPNYTTRSSILQDNNGWNWSWVMGGSRTESVPFVVAEAGDYGLNRWDYERTILEAIVHCLQRTSGFLVFNESQDLDQATASGITYNHNHVGWPSRRLAAMLAAPIVEYRLITPLAEENVAVIDPVQYITRQTEKKTTGLNSYDFQNGWDGSERGYWLKRLYMSFGTPHKTDGYPKILDAAFNNTGVQVTDQVFAKNTGVTVNAPAVAGLVNDLKDTTIGPMALSGVTPSANAVVMIRSDGNFPLFSGPAKLFVHQHSTVTDATGFSGAVDGEVVTSWGSELNTRLAVPAPFVITFATDGKELEVSGVNDDGTVTPLNTVFDANTGTVQFSTDTRFPLYLVVPRRMTPANVLAPIEEPASTVITGMITLSGFAIDLGSTAGTGIDAVHIYLDGPSNTGILIGHTTYGLSRPDVATRYGARFDPSGWELAWDTTGLAFGLHKLYLYAHRSTDDAWSEMLPRGVIIQKGQSVWLPLIRR